MPHDQICPWQGSKPSFHLGVLSFPISYDSTLKYLTLHSHLQADSEMGKGELTWHHVYASVAEGGGEALDIIYTPYEPRGFVWGLTMQVSCTQTHLTCR